LIEEVAAADLVLLGTLIYSECHQLKRSLIRSLRRTNFDYAGCRRPYRPILSPAGHRRGLGRFCDVSRRQQRTWFPEPICKRGVHRFSRHFIRVGDEQGGDGFNAFSRAKRMDDWQRRPASLPRIRDARPSQTRVIESFGILSEWRP
jgi:hypothetical protein